MNMMMAHRIARQKRLRDIPKEIVILAATPKSKERNNNIEHTTNNDHTNSTENDSHSSMSRSSDRRTRLAHELVDLLDAAAKADAIDQHHANGKAVLSSILRLTKTMHRLDDDLVQFSKTVRTYKSRKSKKRRQKSLARYLQQHVYVPNDDERTADTEIEISDDERDIFFDPDSPVVSPMASQANSPIASPTKTKSHPVSVTAIDDDDISGWSSDRSSDTSVVESVDTMWNRAMGSFKENIVVHDNDDDRDHNNPVDNAVDEYLNRNASETPETRSNTTSSGQSSSSIDCPYPMSLEEVSENTTSNGGDSAYFPCVQSLGDRTELRAPTEIGTPQAPATPSSEEDLQSVVVSEGFHIFNDDGSSFYVKE